jgi:hypothetical protein
MVLRTALILGMVGLAVGVWVETWVAVQAKSRAEREWHRVTGTVTGLADPMRPDVKVEQGIEYAPPRSIADAEDERRLQMESDEGLRRFHRYEFLVDPITKRARVAGAGFAPPLLALLGLVYVGLAATFYYLTSSGVTFHGISLPASSPGAWVHFQPPPWHEPAVVSVRSGVWSALKWGLGAAILVTGVVMQWSSRTGTLLSRVGLCSVALFVAGVLSVIALDRATYRIEADSTGLRESSAVGWKVTPWTMLRGAVEETAHHYSGGSWGGRSTLKLDYPTHRVYFTDDQGEEIVSIGDDLDAQQGKALLGHVLARTGLRPEKRERGKR